MALQTASEAAERLSVSVQRVYEMARLGIVPCVRLGRTVRFDPAAIEGYVASGGKALAGGWRREPSE